MGSFVFPYAIAEQAVAAMEDLASRLRAVITTHDTALTVAHHDFAGETREQFDRDFSSTMDALSSYARALDADADELRATLVTAHQLDSLSQATPP